MTISCLNIVDDLNKSIEKANDELIDHMSDQYVPYEYACIKPNITFEHFYQTLRNDWERTINLFLSEPNKCPTIVSKLMHLNQYVTPKAREEFSKMVDALGTIDQSSSFQKFKGVDIEGLALDYMAQSIMAGNPSFVMDRNPMVTLSDLSRILVENCRCQMVDIFKTFVKKYSKIYHRKFENMDKDQVITTIREDYRKFQHMLSEIKNGMNSLMVGDDELANSSESTIHFAKGDINERTNEEQTFTQRLAQNLTNLYSLSVESQLQTLIPEELGSLKVFFIKVITTYYGNLHPIIWAQIFKNLTQNLFIDLPYTPNQIFSFGSKYVLLNSGPFILKILQMVRPVLSPKLAQKYNLTKLTYPLMTPSQVNIILEKVVYYWSYHKILANYSASVGHVCKVIRVDNPNSPFIIKIIKPLAVAQSCWEYKTLHKIFKDGSCEQAFILHMLESNGLELNVQNEMKNIDEGFRLYTASYNEIFDVEIDAKLTTIQNIPNVIIPNSWFALAMTLAPGIPLSKLVEENLLKDDTIYRAKLHRCLDILVYKFFHNLVQNGFYHGDLHAGNIFFSYEKNQMTLIDFGAVGRLNLYDQTDTNNKLLDIIIMSSFYNYDGMFETMTQLVNQKCPEIQVDMGSPDYKEFRDELRDYKMKNIRNEQKDKFKSKMYDKYIFSVERIDAENGKTGAKQGGGQPSIYSHLDYVPTEETIVENKDVLPQLTQMVADSSSITFAGILEKIFKYYASKGINIAIKFNEFYELQKAYALLLGVLTKVHYNSYRTGIAIGKSIKSWGNVLKAATHPTTTYHVVQTYLREKAARSALKTRPLLAPKVALKVKAKPMYGGCGCDDR